MKLIDRVFNGSMGVYSLEDVSEREAVRYVLNADIEKVKPKGDAQKQFAEAVAVLFPGVSLQRAWDYADVSFPHRKDDEALVSKTSPLHTGAERYVDACVILPKGKAFDRKDTCGSSWFNGEYRAGTLVIMETAGSDIVHATFNISRFYGVCGQHKMNVVTRGYRKDVVDDIVDKLGEQQQDPTVRSPIITQQGVFVPGFTNWDKFIDAYGKARALIDGDKWSKKEWDAIRRDSLTADNPAIRELSAERYQAKLKELLHNTHYPH